MTPEFIQKQFDNWNTPEAVKAIHREHLHDQLRLMNKIYEAIAFEMEYSEPDDGQLRYTSVADVVGLLQVIREEISDEIKDLD